MSLKSPLTYLSKVTVPVAPDTNATPPERSAAFPRIVQLLFRPKAKKEINDVFCDLVAGYL